MKQVISAFNYWVVLCLLLSNSPVTAQIENDRSLPNLSNVTRNGNNFTINGGTARGNNLFHSFKQFNVPTNAEAFFNNTNSIENIFTRVTGGSISHIDGILKANGSANLFLINPSGIIFGENARLNIGGSFFGTTAQSIKFIEGEFSAVNPQAPPLLKINVPIGLQMGTSGKIQVKGSGHNLITQDINFTPYINQGNPNLLKVEPGKTLALIGGDITLDGGILNAATAIELTSVREGKVNFTQSNQGFQLDITPNSKLGNIELAQKSLIDVSAGSIQVNGGSVSLKGGSVLNVQNQGLQPAGDINVNATESLDISNISADGKIRSGLINETLAGNSGNINIVTPRLIIKNGAGIGSRTFSPGYGGNINLDVSELIEVGGISEINPAVFSAIASTTFAAGKSGNISINTRQLSVSDGATVAATSFSSGNGGNVNINAQNIKVKGSGAGLFGDSTIASSTFGKGDGGDININTARLTIDRDASINTTSNSSGNAGNIAIFATEAVRVIDQGSLESDVVQPNQLFQSIFNLPKIPDGNGGNITINTPFLLIANQGDVSVSNLGTGDAGIIEINADLLKLDNLGSLSATTKFGEGGNILLQSQRLQMRHGSIINTSAGGNGNGGNITINTDTLVALQNSDITANAENSFGGKVLINAQGIFGTRYREQLTSESDITASSKLGASFNGVVKLNTPGIDPNSGLAELPINIIDPSSQIASRCADQTGSSFAITGRGRMPQNPGNYLIPSLTWSDIRDLSTYRDRDRKKNPTQATISQQTAIVEATGFVTNEFGEVELVAQIPENSINWQQTLDCGEAKIQKN